MIKTNLRYKLFRSNKAAKLWFFNIQSRNGNVIAASQGYRRRANALKTLNLLKPALAPIEEKV